MNTLPKTADHGEKFHSGNTEKGAEKTEVARAAEKFDKGQYCLPIHIVKDKDDKNDKK